MAGKYDTSFKELVTHHFGALLPWLLPGVHGAEVVRLPEELPATARHADLILRCDREGSGSVLYLIECQCQFDPKLAADLLLRAALAHRQHGVPVETLLLAFTPQAAIPEDYTFGARPQNASRHTITVRPMYEESAEQALATGIDALLPWITAMKTTGGDSARLLATVLDRIIERIEPDSQRLWMLDQATTFATLRLSRSQVQGIVREVVERRRYMLDPIRDFPWLRGAYEDGIEKGMEQGKAAGVSEGMAASILTVLASRGVVVDDILRQRILKCQDQDRLHRWLLRAGTAATASEVVDES
jgi:hypothetical protein